MRKIIHHLFWRVSYAFRFIDMNRYGIEYKEKNAEPKEAFVVLSNHSFYLDGFLVGYGIRKPVIFLSTDEIPLPEQVGGRIARCLYTEKGTPDVNAVVQMRKFLTQGESVGLFPEGDRCWDGQTDKLNPGLPRLLKAFKAPVRIVNISGGYLSDPRWSKYGRTGKIFGVYETLSADQIMTMDENKLYDLLAKKLDSNDIKNPQLKTFHYKGKKMAEGIHNLIWLCPECGTHDSIYGEGNIIACRHCEAKWSIDGWGGVFFQSSSGQKISSQKRETKAFDDIQDWNNFQLETIEQWVSAGELNKSDKLLTVSKDITLTRYTHTGVGMRYSGRKYKVYGRGRMELYCDVWKFIPNKKEVGVKPLEFNTLNISCFVEGLNENFSFHYNNERFRIDIPKSNSLKYFHFFRYRTGFYKKRLSCS